MRIFFLVFWLYIVTMNLCLDAKYIALFHEIPMTQSSIVLVFFNMYDLIILVSDAAAGVFEFIFVLFYGLVYQSVRVHLIIQRLFTH